MKIKKGMALCFLSFGVTFSAGGCSLGEITVLAPEPEIKTAYSCEYTAAAVVIPPETGTETEFCFGGTLQRAGADFFETTLTSPETLSGLKIVSSGDNVSASLGELSFDTEPENIPDASPFMAIFTALDCAAVSEAPLSALKDGGYELDFEKGVMTFDGSGVPVTLTVKEPAVTVTFSAFENKTAADGNT